MDSGVLVCLYKQVVLRVLLAIIFGYKELIDFTLRFHYNESLL